MINVNALAKSGRFLISSADEFVFLLSTGEERTLVALFGQSFAAV